MAFVTSRKAHRLVSVQPGDGPSRISRSQASAYAIQERPGNQYLQRLLESRRLQAKLTLSQSGDKYEQEADRVADQVMRIPGTVPATARPDTLSTGLQIQRVCPKCEGELQRQPDEEEEEMVQAKETPGWTPVVSNSMVQRIRGLRSGGSPLPPSDRSFFEPRFGMSFNQVRVHTDARASKMAKSVNARAFTFGNDIVFRGGEFASHTLSGRRLLAHELTHVVQQTASQSTVPRTLQRDVKESHVSCRNTGLHGGVPGGVISGSDAVAVIKEANERAVELARRAEVLIDLLEGTYPDFQDPVFNKALADRFGLSLARAGDRRRIIILAKELKAVADYLKSGYPFYTCRGPRCGSPSEWAYSLVPGNRIYLCNPFWNAASTNLKGSTILHEAIHLWWDQIDDQGKPPLHNAHCFEQFTLDLAGATSEIPASFSSACVV